MPARWLCAGLLALAPIVTAAEAPAGAGAPTIARVRAAPDVRDVAAEPRFTSEVVLVERVLTLENERLALMPVVAAWKWQHHAPVSDPARERIVIQRSAQLAAPLDLDAGAIERLFELQMRLARDAERDRQRAWQAHGFDFPAPVPDLARELRPRIDRLTGELLRAIYLAEPALSRRGFAERYAALASERLQAAGWTPRSRAELLEVLATVRLAPSSMRPPPPSLLERIRRAGVLRVGTTGDYAPFSVEEGDRLSGADVELARSLARSLGVEPMFVRTSWPALLDDLRRGAFDVAVGGISATPARAAAAALSIPYLSGGKTIVARCADASRLDSLAALDRPAVRVIENPGGTNEQFAREHLRRARIRLYPSNSAIFDELLAGRADAMITDDTEADLQTRRHPQLCRTLPGTLTHAEKAILMPRDAALVNAVNTWLRGEIAKGTPAQRLQNAMAEECHPCQGAER